MEQRKELKLTTNQHYDLCTEHYLEINNEHIEINVIEDKYDSGTRHTEIWNLIFEIVSTGEIYSISYETSVKDSMGWSECNQEIQYIAIQVFPKKIETIIYE